MFENLDNKNAAGSPMPMPPAPQKAEDIFSATDKSPGQDLFAPKRKDFPSSGSAVIPEILPWMKNKVMIFCFIFGGLAVIVAGGYFGLRFMVKNSAVKNNNVILEDKKSAPANQEIPQPSAPESEQPSDNQDQQNQPQPIDSDADGLTDEEEAGFGTDPNNADTDADGLTDREETKVYATDPIKSDTDADGYSDGQEVQNNYNPSGPGKLHEIK